MCGITKGPLNFLEKLTTRNRAEERWTAIGAGDEGDTSAKEKLHAW